MSYQASMKRVSDVHEVLARGDDITDEYILEQLKELHIITNTLNAARIMMKVIAPVCSRRPHLAENLLPEVLLPLWMTGLQTDQVISWIRAHLDANKPFDMTETSSLVWINGLLDQRELIDRLLEEIEDEVNRIDMADIRQQLTPHSQVAIERIRFQSGYIERKLEKEDRSIVFIQLGLEEEGNARAFRELTKALADVDPNEQIALFVIGGEDYVEIVSTDIQRMLGTSDAEDDLVQAIWFRGWTALHVVKAGERDLETYLSHIRNLLDAE